MVLALERAGWAFVLTGFRWVCIITGAGELHRPGGAHRGPRRRVCAGARVDAHLLRAAGDAQGAQEGHPARDCQHVRLHRQSNRAAGVQCLLCGPVHSSLPAWHACHHLLAGEVSVGAASLSILTCWAWTWLTDHDSWKGRCVPDHVVVAARMWWAPASQHQLELVVVLGM